MNHSDKSHVVLVENFVSRVGKELSGVLLFKKKLRF